MAYHQIPQLQMSLFFKNKKAEPPFYEQKIHIIRNNERYDLLDFGRYETFFLNKPLFCLVLLSAFCHSALLSYLKTELSAYRDDLS